MQRILLESRTISSSQKFNEKFTCARVWKFRGWGVAHNPFQTSDDCPIYDDKYEKKEKEKEKIGDKDNDDIIKKIIELDTDDTFDDNEEEEIDSFFEDLYKNMNNNIENMHKKENDIHINYPKLRNSKKNKNKFRKKSMNKIPSKKVKLYYLEIEQNDSKEKNAEYMKEIEEIDKSKNIFEMIKAKLDITDKEISYNKKIDYKCLRNSIQLFKDECSLNERDLEFISTLSDICSIKDIKLDDISNAIIEVCKNKN